MSFLTAAMLLGGGIGRGLQQRQQNQQEQQRLNDQQKYEQAQIGAENARIGIEQAGAKRDQDTYDRNLGIDPATGQKFPVPKALMRVVPHPVGTNYKVTPQDQLAHLYAWLKFYSTTGQKDAAADTATQISGIQQEMLREQTQAAEDYRTGLIIQGENHRADMTGQRERAAEDRREQFDAWLRGQPTYRDLHPINNGGKPATPEAVAKSTASWYNDWSRATKAIPGHLKDPSLPAGPLNPVIGAKQPEIPVAVRAIAGKMFSAIDASTDPIATAQKFASSTPNAVLKDLLYKRAAIAASKHPTAFSPPTGGSDGAPPFPQ